MSGKCFTLNGIVGLKYCCNVLIYQARNLQSWAHMQPSNSHTQRSLLHPLSLFHQPIRQNTRRELEYYIFLHNALSCSI